MLEAKHQRPNDRKQELTLEKETEQILEEARMVMPGVQALFGFQLIAIFNQRFAELDLSHRCIHLAATMMTAIAVLLVLSPAAYHRQAEPHCVSGFFVRIASRLLALTMFALSIGICLDFYLLCFISLRNIPISALLSAGLYALFFCGWFVWPRLSPRHA